MSVEKQHPYKRRTPSAFALLMAGRCDYGQYIERCEMEERAEAELAAERAAVGLSGRVCGPVDSLAAENSTEGRGLGSAAGETAEPEERPEPRCDRGRCDIRLVWRGFRVPLAENCVVCGAVFRELVEDRRFLAGSVA